MPLTFQPPAAHPAAMNMARRASAVIVLSLAAFTVLCAGSAHAVETCTAQKSARVQEQLKRIASWDRFARLYEQSGDCDKSGQSRAFSRTVAQLAAQPGGVIRLDAAIRKRPWLKPVALRHLRSGVVSREESRQIIANADRTCPRAGRQTALCREVRAALRPRK
ncbi:hypothetical protein [Diaphorobacter ruginosibacter]|uniref:hypothetical protein n=1 Tax=Diaphorobacter ruginosibacter TaxID=1715720 RepID=UPI00333E6C78